jgi:two-component system sensor histidine kinase/response regulator
MMAAASGKKCVLIVEDSRTQAEALRTLLDEAGYVVSVARSGGDALTVLAKHDTDLVISDVIMPGMNGFDLCRAVRRDPSIAALPFILLTSLAEPLDIMRGLECGADNYATKPYDPDVLLRRVERTMLSGNLRRADAFRDPIDVSFLGSTFEVGSTREQILDVLISSFEDVVRANAALRAAEGEREALYEKEKQARLESEQARKRAEEANKAKSEFLAMMSHDLRTPLNAIGGYAELLALGVRGPVSELQLSDLERIRRNQRHLINLVNDVLSFARLETGEIPLNITAFNLSLTVGPLRAVIETQAAKREIGYTFVPSPDVVTVRADSERMEQVLINLLGNAVKFTQDGGQITVTCGSRDGMGFVEVQDSGIGIPEAKLHLIFDAFMQVDANRGKRDGVGLGLAISRKLALAMGGDVTVRSEEGKGSTFTLLLPLESDGGAPGPRRD